MSKHPFISRVTSDVLDREKNALVTANVIGKIFAGKLENALDFNSLFSSGCYRFDATSQNGPTNVAEGYVLIHGINPDYNPTGSVRIRQIVYPDSGKSPYTRTGSGTSVSSVTWTRWTVLGGGSNYQNYVELTEDTAGELNTYYRAFSTYVLTLPDSTSGTDGDSIGLEQHDGIGIIIDSNSVTPVENKYLYDKNTGILFQQIRVTSEVFKWQLIEGATVVLSEDKTAYEVTVGGVTTTHPVAELTPTTEVIEYVTPEDICGTLYPQKFEARITTNIYNVKIWMIQTAADLSTAIKTLVSHINEIRNEVLAYVDEHDTPYHSYSTVTAQGAVGVVSTLYKGFETSAVLTLPNAEDQNEGRWVGLEQHRLDGSAESIGYVVDSHLIPESTTYVYDEACGKLFKQFTNSKGSWWTIVSTEGHDLPSLVNTDFKVKAVDATSSTKLFESYITKDSFGTKVWAILDVKNVSFF